MPYNFTHLSTADGLASNEALAVLMNSQGFMWFGTGHGLSRYDGHGFKNYYHDLADSTGLKGHFIKCLAEDKEGYLWIGTARGGLHRFDPSTEVFEMIDYNWQDTSGVAIEGENDLLIDVDNNLWIATQNKGVYRYNLKTQVVKNFRLSEGKYWKLNMVKGLCEDPIETGKIWIGAYLGLYYINRGEDSLRLEANVWQRGAKTLGARSNRMFMDKQQRMWISTHGEGLYEYHPTMGEKKVYTHSEVSKINGITHLVEDVAPYGQQIWLAGERNGLGILNLPNRQLNYYKSSTVTPSNHFKHLHKIYQDRAKRMWLCDRLNGVFYLDEGRQIFQYYELPLEEKYSDGTPPRNRPWNFAYDKKREQYYIVSNYGGGLYIYDKHKNWVKTVSTPPLAAYNFNHYLHVFIDSRDIIWVLDTHTGNLLQLEDELSKLTIYKNEQLDKLRGKRQLREIIEDESGFLWIGTWGAGLLKLEVETGKVWQYEIPNYEDKSVDIQYIRQGKNGIFWLYTTTIGLLKFDTKTTQFTLNNHFLQAHNDAPDSRLRAIEIDRHGQIWVGSIKGLHVYDPNSFPDLPIKSYGYQDGVPTGVINYLARDQQGRMWVYTNGGLGLFEEEKNSFKSFGVADGLVDKVSIGKMKVVSTGEIFIAQDKGFHVFHPDSLPYNNVPPKIVFTSFKVLEKEKKFEKSITHTKEVILDYQENYFTLTFAALNYTRPEKNQYAYQMEGVNKDWIYSDNRNFATYTNLREGDYIFKVKAANNDGVWNDKGIQLAIQILPPWYRSNWAYVAYMLLVTGIVYQMYRYQRRRWQLQTELQLEQREALRLKEMDEVKNRFYTNITHEFRTPLTVILGMSQQLEEKVHAQGKDWLQLIQKNGQKLLSLINQLLDLSKLDSGELELNLSQAELMTYLRYTVESYHSYAELHGIELELIAETTEFYTYFDKEKLEQIGGNLLNNAIKFTPKGGKIEVLIRVQTPTTIKKTHQLIFKIKDNGIGIATAQIPHIFNRFYQVDGTTTRSGEGTGIGLSLTRELVQLMGGKIEVESQMGKGTTFTIQLPFQVIKPTILEKQPIEKWTSSPIQNGTFNGQNVLSPKSMGKTEKPQLLIIEDNPDVVQYIATCLKEQYQIDFAENGAIGIEKAIANIPDLIISDVMMPEKDGFEVCETLKQDERTSHIPIVLLTAKATQKDKITGLKQGADAYLMKPFDEEELTTRLEQLLLLRQRLQARYRGAWTNDTKEIPNFSQQAESLFLQKINTILEQQLDNPELSVEGLAQKLFISRTQLHRKLKALTDCSASAYIRKFRLHQAKILLLEVKLTHAQIALETGFQSSSYFSRAFSKEFGMSPSSFQKQQG